MWWRKRKTERPAQAIVRSNIGKAMERLQIAFVRFMQAREQRWSMRQKKVYFFLFCAVAFGLFGWVILDTLWVAGNRSAAALQITPIQRTLTPPHATESHWTREDTLSVRQFRAWIDSLSQTTEGRRALDSCWRERPGLKDSFELMETIINHKKSEE